MERILTKEERTIIRRDIERTRYNISQAQDYDKYLSLVRMLNLLTIVGKRRYIDDSIAKDFREAGYMFSNASVSAVPCSSGVR